MTGRSLEQWQKDGYVVGQCPCNKHTCKGWNLTPIEHHRTAARSTVKTEPITAESITPEQTRAVKASLRKEWLERIFARMFVDGLLKKGKKDSTIIPKDGPITWTHEEQLAFAQGFEMDELLTLEGKPRELQRRLIAALRDLGYDVLSAPEKTK